MNKINYFKIYESIKDSDAIVVGAGAGMSTSAGFTYGGERFERLFPEYIKNYGMEDMYSGGFYPFKTQEEKWAYWSKHIYYNEKQVREMVKEQKQCKIPSNLVPKCPVCSGHMEVNLRCDSYFVEDENWYASYDRYKDFLEKNINKNIVFIELGIGMNTPSIIKYPFWKMTSSFPKAKYICINLNEVYAPPEIESQSICIDKDISTVLQKIKNMEV